MSYNTPAYKASEAFDPAASVFVSANAGAGKTSLLTNRVLAMLLHGVSPSRLLCLTFTHAAAAEMANRVLEKLGAWVMADEVTLGRQLQELLDRAPDKTMMARARSLFARVLEAPEGIRIQTIHGFCQSLLRRFPVEAGISPHFTVMDSRTEQTLLQEARLRLFSKARDNDPVLQQGLNAIAHALSESSFQSLLKELIQHKRRLRSLLTQPGGVLTAVDRVWRFLNISPDATQESLAARHFNYTGDTLAQLRHICSLLMQSESKTDLDTGRGLALWLESPRVESGRLQEYIDCFITEKGQKRKKLFTVKILTLQSDIDALLAEQERVWKFLSERRALEVATRTTHILHVADSLLALYDKLKNMRALMDYDDLILTACNLLQQPGIAPWVLYKLDGGIDHILVDEAQDTSPEQWTIIDALTQEFFSGQGRKALERSLFVVGDEKQSIYSFQGADPMALGRKKQYFSTRIRDAAMHVHNVSLVRSYRSLPEVLAAVDAVFAQPEARQGLMFDNAELKHEPHRTQHAGLVEVWPLVRRAPEEDENSISPITQLARHIAGTIRKWLDDGIALEAKGRAVEPGDIMILVGKRTSLVDRLVKALKRRNIPVAGHDRMALGDNLAVKDLIALGQFLLLPEDNLTLAEVLKSPIGNLSEEELFQLSWGRGDNHVWEQLRQMQASRPVYKAAFDLLTDLRARADFVSPYELYSYLLDTLGMRRRIIGRMGEEYNDSIDEFLGQALLYERSNIASMQGFIHWLNSSDSEIKRDMEQAGNCVRIMTVHGAKGLQAPIVILPDTVEPPKPRDTLLWYEDEHLSMPFWPVSTTEDEPFCEGLRSRQKDLMYAEYRRLLYVALTRAEDRLYICGATNKDNPSQQCWYNLVQSGLKAMAVPFDMAWGQGLRIGNAPLPSRTQKQHLQETASYAAPDFSFLKRSAPVEPTPSQPLVPSRLVGDEPAAASPFSDVAVFQRGNFIHKLLQYLPQVPMEKRPSLAQGLSVPYQKILPDDVLRACISEAQSVINHPEFAFLFAPDAMTEVPVAGSVNVQGTPVTVAGQIDRLHIGRDGIWIVDFKSNRLPPTPGQPVPASYLRQMQLYRLLLKQIYPSKTVRCALLWTSTAAITVIDEALLDEVPLSSYI